MKFTLAVLFCCYGFWTFAEGEKKIVIIGDSITEGYGVSHEQAYPALVQKKIEASGKPWVVVNSGISGSTSASAPGRVTWHLKQKPDLIVLALGANDGLRGLPTKSMEDNLGKAIAACKKAGVKVLVAGMLMPPNYGVEYSRQFAAVFPHLAKKYEVGLIPFLLDKVGGNQSLNQTDGIHPNEKGHQIVAETVYQAIVKAL